MVSSSKILTVSYGTFSCTAEGFEDPLAVVKDATHFFRGVVREDRFFGAEPPQFDPDMAAEILQSQLSSEAGQGSLSLRAPFGGAASAGAMGAALAAGPALARGRTPQPDPGISDTTETDERPAEKAEVSQHVARDDGAAVAAAMAMMPADNTAEVEPVEAVIEAPEVASQIVSDEQGDDSLDAEAAFFAAGDDAEDEPAEVVAESAAIPAADPDSVAAKLRRIRAVVAGGAASAAASPAAAALDAAEPEAESETAFDASAVSAMMDTLAPESEEPEAASEDEADNLFADTLAGIDFEDEEPVLDASEVVVDELPESEGEDFELDAFEDDETEDGFQDGALAAALAQAAPAPVPETEAGADTDEAATAPVVAAPKVRARVVKVKRAEFEAAVAEGKLEEVAEDTVSSLSPEDEDDLTRELEAVKAELSDEFDEDGWDDEEVSKNPEPVAADDEDDWMFDDEDEQDSAEWDEEEDEPESLPTAATVSDDFEDEWDDEGADGAFDETPEPLRLRADDARKAPVAAWQDDLDDEFGDEFDEAFNDEDEPAAARQQDADDTDEDEFDDAIERMARDGVRKAVKLTSPARVMLTEQSVEDNDTSRILDETNTQMEEPEGNRRRSAIAHLRAAVAATRADKLLHRKREPEDAAEAYREDLANVVRPRRPQATHTGAERPAAEPVSRPAPLKLVAEQRVDEERAAAARPSAPMRPRRVTVADLEPEMADGGDQDGGFAEYAERVGATELSELLEAAAAYMSYVEGREQFSRPQLMTKVRQVEVEESSREDRLRSFGQLLRDGKIEKTRGGRFTASDRISFKPGARAAG